MRENGNLIFIGLPQSGKSTFIAALWHVIVSSELDEALKITALPNQREYLKELSTSWLSCKKLTRNVGKFKNEIVLKVSTSSGKNSELLFPDLAGEIYESHFSNRKIENDFIDKLNASSNIVLFINPDNLKKPMLISDAGFLDELESENTLQRSNHNTSLDINDAVKEPNAGEISEPTESDNWEKEWEYKFAPTQVILVDILQMMLEYIESPKIVVVISAWDLILSLPDGDTSKKHPKLWLENELPLLNQFLESNRDLLEFKIFGISAQGGDYDGDKDKLQEEIHPSKRIIVQKETGEISSDISLPIKWLLDVEE